MLIRRPQGYVYIPSVYWLGCLALTPAVLVLFGEWRDFAGAALMWALFGFMAIDSTFRVSRGSEGSLVIRKGWNRSQPPLAGRYLVVEHSSRSYYSVVLSGGTALTGPMLLGRCIRIGEHIAADLDLPLRVSQEQQEQAQRAKRLVLGIVLSMCAFVAAGFAAFLLSRR